MIRLFKGAFRLIIRLIYVFYIRRVGNISIGDNLKLNGIPKININKGCCLKIGSNVSFESLNDSYHLNLFAPLKLLADRENAVIEIGDNTYIAGSCIHAYKKISIGKNCLIAANCQIFDGNGHDLSFDNVANRVNTRGGFKEVVISDSVWLGANCIIMPGVHIGEGSIISAGSVVVNDIPSMCIAGGNPAKVIKSYKK